MQTLKNSEKIKDYVVENIRPNLKKVNVSSLNDLIKNVNLDVYADSDNANLNDDFNSLIYTLKKVDTKNTTIWHVTEFFYYYQKILQEMNLAFSFPQ